MLAADTLASYGSLAMFKDVTRIARTGSYTLVGASGELSDYHALLDKLKGLAQANANCDDGFEHGPAEIYSYLRAVLYQRRNKFDPLWNSLVVGGFKDGAPFLGSVDLRGTAYEDDVIATGYGSHLALPIMRAKWRAVLRKLFHGRPHASWPSGGAGGFDAALKTRFGLELPTSEPDCARLSAPELGQWN